MEDSSPTQEKRTIEKREEKGDVQIDKEIYAKKDFPYKRRRVAAAAREQR